MTKKKVIRNFSEIHEEIFWGNAEIRNFFGRRVKKVVQKLRLKFGPPFVKSWIRYRSFAPSALNPH